MQRNTEVEEEIKQYIVAILKSSAISLANQAKEQIIKVDPRTPVRLIIRKIKQQLQLSDKDSLFMFAYGKLLNGTDTIGEVEKMFQKQIGENRLQISYSQMSAFG